MTLLILVMLILLILPIISTRSVPTSGTEMSVPWAIFVLVWNLVAACAGAYVTSLICVGSRVWHVIALIVTLVALGLLILAGNFSKQPTWFLIAQTVIWVIGAMIGGSVPVQGRDPKGSPQAE